MAAAVDGSECQPAMAPNLVCQDPWPPRLNSSLVFFQNPGLMICLDVEALLLQSWVTFLILYPTALVIFVIFTTYAFCFLYSPRCLPLATVFYLSCCHHHFCGNCYSKQWNLPLGGDCHCLLQVQLVSHLAKGPHVKRVDLP